MADEQSLSGGMRDMTKRIKELRALQEELAASMRKIQEAIAFDHPDLVELDDELDILYRGQL
ncbi:hypothetical protein [Streptomyces anulatus]|uniref:hypothetical protein n=1 Tax=Streptomyces anulatus TaxID=1892 RepID=UPI002ED2E4FD|nr:hypothetical protein OG882_04605 [Streptomyces anulatus]WUD92893.1 hypothetical protein OG703_34035 [Streptomyces anulatus]